MRLNFNVIIVQGIFFICLLVYIEDRTTGSWEIRELRLMIRKRDFLSLQWGPAQDYYDSIRTENLNIWRSSIILNNTTLGYSNFFFVPFFQTTVLFDINNSWFQASNLKTGDNCFCKIRRQFGSKSSEENPFYLWVKHQMQYKNKTDQFGCKN